METNMRGNTSTWTEAEHGYELLPDGPNRSSPPRCINYAITGALKPLPPSITPPRWGSYQQQMEAGQVL